MKTHGKLIQNIIILAALSVVLFTILQLAQHGYDAPPQQEHLVVDIRSTDPINRQLITRNDSIIELEGRVNNIEQEIKEQHTTLNIIQKRLSNLEETIGSNNSNNNTYISPNNIIYSNPLNIKQCQNAILDLEDINIEALIADNSPHISCHKRQNWRPYIWTREGIGSLTNRHCYRPHTPVRTSNDFMNIIKENKSFYAKQESQDVPVYYHIPKCASSSTATLLSEHFDFKQHWVDGPDMNHPKVYTKCGYTFIRNPIHRFISGYYTVNNMLWRDCRDENGMKTFSNHSNDKYNKYKFIRIMREPERFEMYIEEMVNDPYHFGKTLPFRHTGSQMYFLSNWFGSDIEFFGRVERFEEHWNELMQWKECGWDKYNMKKNDEMHVPNSMYHYGFYGPTLWKKSNGEKKEYVDALGMRANLEKMYSRKWKNRIDPNDILAPAYYFITRDIYDKIVRYFWQDFVCFGYPTSYENFQIYVAQFLDPNNMTEINVDN